MLGRFDPDGYLFYREKLDVAEIRNFRQAYGTCDYDEHAQQLNVLQILN